MRTKLRNSTRIPLWYWLLSPTQLATSYTALYAYLSRSLMGSEARASRWSTRTPFPESFCASLSCNPTTSSCPLPASSSLSLPRTLLSKAKDDHNLGWGGARRVVGFTESSDLVSLDCLFKCFAIVVGIYSGFEVGIWGWVWSWEVPFLSLIDGVWLCRKWLRIRRGTSNT